MKRITQHAVLFLTIASKVETACVKSLDANKYALIYVKQLLLGRKDRPRTYRMNISADFSDVSCIHRTVPCNSVADAHSDAPLVMGFISEVVKRGIIVGFAFFAMLVGQMVVI